MSSILNSISSGELQVQHVPEVKPVKEDSVIDLLKDVEIEFELPKKERKNKKLKNQLLANRSIEVLGIFKV